MLSALAHSVRIKVFRMLASSSPGGLGAGELAQNLDIPANSLSFHLKELKYAGVIRSERKGRCVMYYLCVDQMNELLHVLLDECCGGQPELCLNYDSVNKLMTKKL